LPENEGMYTAEAIRCHACAGAQKTAAAFAASYAESGTPGAGDGLNWLIRHK